jgi:hypothetical protein
MSKSELIQKIAEQHENNMTRKDVKGVIESLVGGQADAVAYKPDSEPLDPFIKRKGGINACAARFSRCLGRRALGRTAG